MSECTNQEELWVTSLRVHTAMCKTTFSDYIAITFPELFISFLTEQNKYMINSFLAIKIVIFRVVHSLVVESVFFFKPLTSTDNIIFSNFKIITVAATHHAYTIIHTDTYISSFSIVFRDTCIMVILITTESFQKISSHPALSFCLFTH